MDHDRVCNEDLLGESQRSRRGLGWISRRRRSQAVPGGRKPLGRINKGEDQEQQQRDDAEARQAAGDPSQHGSNRLQQGLEGSMGGDSPSSRENKEARLRHRGRRGLRGVWWRSCGWAAGLPLWGGTLRGRGKGPATEAHVNAIPRGTNRDGRLAPGAGPGAVPAPFLLQQHVEQHTDLPPRNGLRAARTVEALGSTAGGEKPRGPPCGPWAGHRMIFRGPALTASRRAL